MKKRVFIETPQGTRSDVDLQSVARVMSGYDELAKRTEELKRAADEGKSVTFQAKSRGRSRKERMDARRVLTILEAANEEVQPVLHAEYAHLRPQVEIPYDWEPPKLAALGFISNAVLKAGLLGILKYVMKRALQHLKKYKNETRDGVLEMISLMRASLHENVSTRSLAEQIDDSLGFGGVVLEDAAFKGTGIRKKTLSQMRKNYVQRLDSDASFYARWKARVESYFVNPYTGDIDLPDEYEGYLRQAIDKRAYDRVKPVSGIQQTIELHDELGNAHLFTMRELIDVMEANVTHSAAQIRALRDRNVGMRFLQAHEALTPVTRRFVERQHRLTGKLYQS